MSRTDLDPATLARSLRRMTGDGSVEWVHEPMQASVLLDIADMLEENAKLRELVSVMPRCWNADCEGCPMAAGKTVYGYGAERCIAEDKLRELGVEVGQ